MVKERLTLNTFHYQFSTNKCVPLKTYDEKDIMSF